MRPLIYPAPAALIHILAALLAESRLQVLLSLKLLDPLLQLLVLPEDPLVLDVADV